MFLTEIRKIIPNLSLLPHLIWSTGLVYCSTWYIQICQPFQYGLFNGQILTCQFDLIGASLQRGWLPVQT